MDNQLNTLLYSVMRYQEYSDYLTGLPNRRYLELYMETAIESNMNIAVVSMDINQFKAINDVRGHSVGDDLIKEVAERLVRVLGKDVLIVRPGGDEFFVVLEDWINTEYVKERITYIIDSFLKPFKLKGELYYLTMSIGISVYNEHSDNIEKLISYAELAMYESKKSGTGFEFFQEQMRIYTEEEFLIESELRHAIENDNIILNFQPKYSLLTGYISGVEGLARIKNSNTSPAIFIPIAEKTGLIHQLGDIVLNKACKEVKKWNDLSPYPLRVAINFSARQFQKPGITQHILTTLQIHNIPPSWLEIEVTESLLLSNDAVVELTNLKQLGIHISVDDFGTGYSSLSYIKGLPIQTLKIDKSFINNIKVDGSNAEITSVILKLADKLGLNVVAEGVEKKHQLAYLKENKCQEVQGYYLKKPLNSREFINLLNNKKMLIDIEDMDKFHVG
ncbi:MULTISPECIES: putative bifunctional diguanylate cyclase/phosphodiesterase [Metabacillus]|uniref:putative bifunctional diguanylate cyclase/phosphodiesterase n=1 Tax=Metabacillus TaxID=2675233 RepID=UPI000C80F4B1|nr:MULTISPECIES: bifunctional diguanylate cyclase/phosphodiesterase [Metabacillus]MCM3443620.1 bifunctional diguanylate cyclase/phosphodiesterase [Metabacillus halosaccharovorans]PMC34222.1 hypothetical protein CJ195_24190 [Bacillus sp. UMB0899]